MPTFRQLAFWFAVVVVAVFFGMVIAKSIIGIGDARAVAFDRKCQAVGFNQRQCEFFRLGADDANPREGERDIFQ